MLHESAMQCLGLARVGGQALGSQGFMAWHTFEDSPKNGWIQVHWDLAANPAGVE